MRIFTPEADTGILSVDIMGARQSATILYTALVYPPLFLLSPDDNVGYDGKPISVDTAATEAAGRKAHHI